MTSAAERLSALRQKLQEARDENLRAVEDEGVRLQTTKRGKVDSDSSPGPFPRKRLKRPSANGSTKRPRKQVDVGSADEAEGEDADDRLRSMKRRARVSHRDRQAKNRSDVDADGQTGAAIGVVSYGGEGGDEDDVDNMVQELQQVERRRAKYRRRRAFDEDRTDITFINEGNRLFNRELERHFDKFESVKKLKDSLERGTA